MGSSRTRARTRVPCIGRQILNHCASRDDPVIWKLAKTQGNVFATDAILATLTSCTRSVYSWDTVVQRVGSKLFFDKRDKTVTLTS